MISFDSERIIRDQIEECVQVPLLTFFVLFHLVVCLVGDLDSKTSVDIMDLILSLNLGTMTSASSSTSKPTTVIMVTHNPDLECYADRILYFEDGRVKKQAINRKQRKIDYEKYSVYINSHH